jgi:hypothetical protein
VTNVQRPPRHRAETSAGLQATLETNVEAARRLLTLALDKIVLRPESRGVVAEFCGNLAGVLSLEPNLLDGIGAGSPSPALYSWPLATAAVG